MVDDSIAWLVLAWILKAIGGSGSKVPSGPPPTFPGPAPVPTSPSPASTEPASTPRTYVIRSGDTPYGLAQRYAGSGSRWKEILAANPALHSETRGGVTQIVPWQIGQTIAWPAGWAAPAGGASPGAPGGARSAPRPPGWVDRRTDQGG